MDTEEELERKAVEELLREAKRGKVRAETMGPMGWMKCPLRGANKRFLINTIRNTLPLSKQQDKKQNHDYKEESSRKSETKKEEHPRKHRFHPYDNSHSRRKDHCSSPRHKDSKRKVTTSGKYHENKQD
ncbi:protein POLR1D-like [Latimeria chalumnae]|uniref:Si:ch211-140b10.6 n=1 Tax=Latimeria chalumnae TaxID=7897 RepID=H3B790_LATCH|nr:PREDICTED: DNA-directed RNA polymerases I and III subunit RPAC2 [Latimeria chalumnae]|eukprot:XP_014342119.1 PREDICTED: DNA-directed RNA polymerases I and III subunit RPAC2 [Latimeria chalumnae]